MADGARVYAGTYDGLQVLEVRGGRCELASDAFPGAIVQALGGCREKAERVFVGLRDGLHRTDDAGVHWHKVLDGDFRSVTIDPTDDRVIYAGTDPVHLFRSEDGGDSWEELASLQRLPDETHERLGEAAPVDMERSHQPTFRHRRQDWWFPVPPHRGHVLQTFIHPDDPNLLLLAIEHGGVARSTDRGQTWEDVSAGIDYLDIHVVTSLPRRFDRYLLTSARGLYTTDDPAKGWTRAQNGCDRDYFHDLVLLPPANGGEPVIVVATAEGSPGFWPSLQARGAWDHSQVGSRAALYRSADGGQSWRRVGASRGLPAEMSPMIWALCVHPHDRHGLFAGLGESSGVPSPMPRGGGAVLTSSDGGESWQTLRANMSAVEHVFAAAE
jgi:photosystem II stability/assembly factor-like uncharacterized protein